MAAIRKIDLKKDLKAFYAPTGTPGIVDLPAMNFLMIDGKGDPNVAPAYVAAIEALYSVSYTLKFTIKRGPNPIDYGVMPLEGLWWAKDMADFARGDKSRWLWTAMILQPSFVTRAQIVEAMAAAEKKNPDGAVRQLRFESFAEGRAAQLMHIGPYSAEAPNIEKLHAFIAAQDGELTGKHHEIYLSDPRRAAPEKLKTIIRQPFAT